MSRSRNGNKRNGQYVSSFPQHRTQVLYLEYYLGRSEVVVKDSDGNVVYYTEGAMKGKPKKKVTHLCKKESLPFYLVAKPTSPQER